jgi:hypothetical protein
VIARRLVVATVALLCAVGCVFAVGVEVALAAPLFGTEEAAGGSEAGEVARSEGLAVGPAGEVFVGDKFNNRVDEFSGSGGSVRAWGFGVLDGASEAQVCTSACVQGLGSTGAGGFADVSGAEGVAVDGDPASGSYGDVYVVDQSNFRVQKFSSSGAFLLAFGGHVNVAKDAVAGATEAERDVCVAGEACAAGTQGAADGEFEWATEGAYIAVGPGGRVYVGDRARVQVFEPSGAWRENISLAGLSATGQVTALAIDGSGDVFVKIGDNSPGQGEGAVPGVRELEPGGLEKVVQFDVGSESVRALSTDAAGDLYVEDVAGGVHFLKFAPSGLERESFFCSTALTSATSGMVFDAARGELLVYGAHGHEIINGAEPERGVWGIPVPAEGPLVVLGSGVVKPELRGAASFEANVIPEGNETSVSFQYVDDAHFKASGFASAAGTTPSVIGSGFEEQHVEAKLASGTLVPGVTYHWRVVATDNAGHTTDGPEGSFEETPPALVEGPWVTNVSSTSATLAAQVDPLGASTEYRLEWGTSTSYEHVFSGSAGEGMGYVQVGGFHVQNLEPGTTYHYRLITTSAVGTVQGADGTFTTQLSGQELALPDGRAWELVSPPNKGGALIEPFQYEVHVTIQAAADGSGIVYMASDALGEDPVGKSAEPSVILASRGAGGWSSRDLNSPLDSLPPEDGNPSNVALAGDEYALFSPDLSLGLLEPPSPPAPLLSPEASEPTPYLRNNLVCAASPQACYTPLLTSGNVQPGVEFGHEKKGEEGIGAEIAGASPDLSHVVVQSNFALTPGSVAGSYERSNLYEWFGGRLRQVNIAPDGGNTPGACLGTCSGTKKLVVHTISNDGRRIVWRNGTEDGSTGSPYKGKEPYLFVRDMVEEKTLRIGGQHTHFKNDAHFQTMSGDGSRIFYLESGELYELDISAGLGSPVQSDLTADHGAAEASADVKGAILGASEDGSYVYFVAGGVLASGASSGANNLYVMHDGAGGWSTTFIATLSSEDEQSWFSNEAIEPNPNELNHVSVSMSPDGRFVAFMSLKSLTGYDNTDAVSGQPDEEVYLYDASADRLVCASCNPTGARPKGVFDNGELMVNTTGGEHGLQRWLGGVIPAWNNMLLAKHKSPVYQPRYLSDSGRLFFDSPDALVPQATNGVMDVYEYEPEGVGGCTAASSTFSARSDGCVGLISAGTSGSESVFVDASENGDDVFFFTLSRLVGEDYDNAYDLYDAHVCSAAVPCRAAPVVAPPCTSGDSCKAAPAPQPAIFGAAPSATFSGVGNVLEEPVKKTVKRKPKPKPKHKPKAKHRKRKPRAKKGSRMRRGKGVGASVRIGR